MIAVMTMAFACMGQRWMDGWVGISRSNSIIRFDEVK
jgi:hypothetical protein